MSKEVLEVLDDLPDNAQVRMVELYVAGEIPRTVIHYETWHGVLLDAGGRLCLKVVMPWDERYYRLVGPHDWESVTDMNGDVEPVVRNLWAWQAHYLLETFEVSIGLTKNAPFP